MNENEAMFENDRTEVLPHHGDGMTPSTEDKDRLDEERDALASMKIEKDVAVHDTRRGIASVQTSSHVFSAEMEAGAVLNDRYEIVKIIGRGGFGIVYEAKDRTTDDRVAIKTLRHNQEDYELAVRRFQREIELSCSLQSDHAVKIYDSGIAADGTLFYVMEFLEGFGLDELLDRHEKFSFCDLHDILLQVLQALGEAHRHGIVHRDIKPANIWLKEKEVGMRQYDVKVLDFGIAKVVSGTNPSSSQKLTQTGAWLGSPAYMSPEQLRGAEVLPSSDIFSLGLLAIEMLTGYPAVEGDSPMDIAIAILSENEIFIEDWLLPTSIGQIIAKCVNKNPSERYQNGDELAEALSALDKATLSNAYVEAKLSRRNRTRRSSNPPTSALSAEQTATLTAQITLNHEEQKRMRTQLFMLFGIFMLISIITVLLIIKFYVIAPSAEKTDDPKWLVGLRQSAVQGYAHGVSEPLRADFRIITMPEGAEVFRVSDGQSIGVTPLSVHPMMIPFFQSSENDFTQWNLEIRMEGFENYPLTIVPKGGTMSSINVQLMRKMPPLGPDGKPMGPPPHWAHDNHANPAQNAGGGSDPVRGEEDKLGQFVPKDEPPKAENSLEPPESSKETAVKAENETKKTTKTMPKKANSNLQNHSKGKTSTWDVNGLL